jgi:hypothetical protein
MNLLFSLLLLCHFFADYTHLSTKWILDAKRYGTPTYPILCHAGLHAFFMAVVLKCFGCDWLTVAVLYTIQLLTHFAIDVWKGRMNVWFPSLQSPANKWHWWIFGIDQTLHILVILWIVNIAIR